jgi:hypothetical protein
MAPISNASRLAEFGSGIGTDGAVIQVDNTNKRVGIGTTNPQSTLQVGTGVSVYGNVGIVSATEVRADTLRGDGTNITGVVGVGTLNVRTETVTTSGVSTFAGVTKVTDTTDATSTTTGALIISGGVGIAKSLHVGQNITIGGTLTYEDVTNIDSLGVVTARSGVNVSGGQFLVGSGITFGSAGVATFSGTGDVHLTDNVQLKLGTGSDGTITHNGSNLEINESSGDLRLVSDADDVIIQAEDDVVIRDNDGSTSMAKFINGGSVELYEAGTKKFETTTSGATIQGNLTVENSTTTPVVTSTSSDYVAKFESTDAVARLIVEDNGSTSDGNGIQVQSDNIKILAGSETALSATKDGSTDIYYNNSKKWETTNDGTVTTGIATATGVDVTSNLIVGSGVTIGSAGVATFSGTADIHLHDSVQLKIGDSSDLALYHNASGNSWIYNGTNGGDLYIGANAGEIYFQTGASANDTAIKIVSDSFVELRHNNNWKLQTTNDGIYVNGIGTATRSYVNTPSQREDDNIPLLVKGITLEDPVIGIQGKSSNGVTLLADAYVDGESQMTLGIHYSGSALVLGQVGVSTDTNNAYVSIQDAYAHRPGAMVIDDGAIKFRNDSADGVRPVGTAVTMYDRMTIENSGRVLIGDGSTYSASGNLHVVGDNNSNGPELYLQVNNNNTTDNIGALWYGNNGDKSLNKIAGHTKLASNTSYLTFHTSKAGTLAEQFQINNDGVVVTGIASDAKGDLRSIPVNSQSGAYVLVAADAGKAVYISTGGVTINTSVFATGDAVTIINNSGSDQTITQGSSFTLYNTSDASTGNRTLAGRGMATVWFSSANAGYISGAGLS